MQCLIGVPEKTEWQPFIGAYYIHVPVPKAHHCNKLGTIYLFIVDDLASSIEGYSKRKLLI